MHNPLKRLARGDQPKVPLRERLAQAKAGLAATKEKYARTLRVHRTLNDPLPSAVSSVDRAALVNYATFLALERQHVCAELYPHMGRRAVAFVLALNAGDRFFYNRDGYRRMIATPASTRALKVLDLVGIDWREDTDESSRRFFDEGERADTGERPAVPHGWPAPDAALLEALDDLQRLDAARRAFHDNGDPSRGGDSVPGSLELQNARDDALDRLAQEQSRSLTGLQAKARAMLMPTVEELPGEQFSDIASSLARDLLGAHPTWLDDKPDPILALIEEAERLEAAHEAVFDEPYQGDRSDTPEHIARRDAACDAKWAFVRGTLFQTVPRTAGGCKALARFAHAFLTAQGSDWSDDAPAVLALIARSPLL